MKKLIVGLIAALTMCAAINSNAQLTGVVGWGTDPYGGGVLNIPAGLTSVAAISDRSIHAVALKSDGTVIAWGDNTFGQLNIPTGLNHVTGISTALLYYYTLALKSDGTVVGWGYGAYGSATPPEGLSGVTAISAGTYHSLALKSDGTVVGWGYNDLGAATPPVGLTGVVAISAGSYHSLALKSDGTVVAWGYNGEGEVTVPAGLTGVTAISAGYLFSLAVKSDGTVVTWGLNVANDPFGNPSNNASDVTGVKEVSAGSYYGLALRFNGTVAGLGDDGSGAAWPPADLQNATSVSAGYAHGLALTTVTPSQAINTLKENVHTLLNGGALLPADGNSLLAKLDAALSQIAKSHINAAISYLKDFISQVQALNHTGRLTSAQGQPLIYAAADIITALGE